MSVGCCKIVSNFRPHKFFIQMQIFQFCSDFKLKLKPLNVLSHSIYLCVCLCVCVFVYTKLRCWIVLSIYRDMYNALRLLIRTNHVAMHILATIATWTRLVFQRNTRELNDEVNIVCVTFNIRFKHRFTFTHKHLNEKNRFSCHDRVQNIECVCLWDVWYVECMKYHVIQQLKTSFVVFTNAITNILLATASVELVQWPVSQ